MNFHLLFYKAEQCSAMLEPGLQILWCQQSKTVWHATFATFVMLARFFFFLTCSFNKRSLHFYKFTHVSWADGKLSFIHLELVQVQMTIHEKLETMQFSPSLNVLMIKVDKIKSLSTCELMTCPQLSCVTKHVYSDTFIPFLQLHVNSYVLSPFKT